MDDQMAISGLDAVAQVSGGKTIFAESQSTSMMTQSFALSSMEVRCTLTGVGLRVDFFRKNFLASGDMTLLWSLGEYPVL